jgi:hypothetical protein
MRQTAVRAACERLTPNQVNKPELAWLGGLGFSEGLSGESAPHWRGGLGGLGFSEGLSGESAPHWRGGLGGLGFSEGLSGESAPHTGRAGRVSRSENGGEGG